MALRVTVPGTEYTLVPPHLLPLAQQPIAMAAACAAQLQQAAAAPTRQASLQATSLAGFMLVCLRETGRAVDLLQDCARAQEQIGDTAGLVGTRLRLAQALQLADRAPDAATVAAAALAAACGPAAHLRHFALHHLGKALLQAGEPARARTVLLQALALRMGLGDASLVQSTEAALALLAAAAGGAGQAGPAR